MPPTSSIAPTTAAATVAPGMPTESKKAPVPSMPLMANFSPAVGDEHDAQDDARDEQARVAHGRGDGQEPTVDGLGTGGGGGHGNPFG